MSSDVIALKLQARTEVGKAVKQLRRDGLVPANIYERGKPSQAVMGKTMEMTKVYHAAGKHHPVNLEVDGKQHLAMIKDVDLDPVKGVLWHVAFHAVNRNETVTAEVPIRLKEGDIPAQRANLMILTPVDMVEVEAKPGDLPNEFEVDASSLAEVGDRLTIADLKVPHGVVITADPDLIIAVVEEPKDQVAAAAAMQAEQAAADAEASGEAAPATAPAEGDAESSSDSAS